jgi:hypothetical protein
MDMNKNEIIIDEEIKPFWKLIIAAIFYCSSLCFIYLTFHYWSIRWIYYGTRCLEFTLLLMYIALFFSVRRILVFNTEIKILKIEYRVGNMKINSSKILDLEYISVFYNNQNTDFEVNIWYKTNSHLNVTIFEDKKTALKYGEMFSKTLNIGLLDATENGNSKWLTR